MKLPGRVTCMAAALGLAGCGGGGGSSLASPVVAPVASANAVARATFTITVPAPDAQTSSRRVKYISPNVQSIIIALIAVNASPVTTGVLETAANLTSSNPACSGSPLTCTFAVPAVVGIDDFTVATYDRPQTSTAPATPAGNLLSEANDIVPIVAGTNAEAPLTLAGVPASLSVTFASDANTTAHVSGSVAGGFGIVGDQPYTFTFSATDATGATIVGPGAPTLSSLSSAVSIVADGGTTYTAQVHAFSANSVIVEASTPSSSPLYFRIATVSELWIAQFAAGNVAGLALYSRCSPACAQVDTISAGLASPSGIAFDPQGDLWVADFANNTVTKYVPGTNAVVATINVGAGSAPNDLAIDAGGDVTEANSGTQTIETFSPVNLTTPANTITGTPVSGLAYDPKGILWASLYGKVQESSGVSTFGTIALSAPGLTVPNQFAFDAQGNLWIANGGNMNPALVEYAAPLANGASPAIAYEKNFNTTPEGVALDGAGNVYVASSGVNEIDAYSTSSVGTELPGFPISVSSVGRTEMAIRP
jgi:sugar lactone lactonase YvrE